MRENERWSFSKKYMEICFFFKCSEKIVFPKKWYWNMIFLVLSGKMVLFYPKIYFFFWRKMKNDLPQEIHESIIFSVYMYKCYKYNISPLPKNQRRSSPEKINLKMIDILHWYSRKSSNDSLYFYGDLHRRFHILLSSEKKNKQET